MMSAPSSDVHHDALCVSGKCLVLFKRYSELFALMAALEGPKARSSCLFPTLQPAFKTAGGRLFPGKHPFNPNLNLHHTTRSQRARLFKDYLNSLFRVRKSLLPHCTLAWSAGC